MYFKLILSFTLVILYSITSQASVGGYICPNDRKKLLTVLVKALINTEGDFSTPYYGVKGFKLLNEQIVTVLVKDNCAHIKKYYKPDCTSEENFQALSAWNLLECSGKLHTDATLNNLKSVLENPKSTISEIRYAAETLKLLGVAIPNSGKVAQLIQTKLKEDDSLQNLGHALHTAALLGSSGNFIQDRIEEVVVQADEVDGKLLQWEGGLTTTSLLITGLLRFPNTKPLNIQQAEKLASYLLTRRTVQTPKGALALLEAATSLASSDVSPVSISVSGPPQVTLDKPELKVYISDILGNALKSPPSPVVAQSATRITDDVVVLSKQPLSPGSPVEFVLPLRLEPGQYRIALTAGSHSTTLTVRVLGPVSLESLQIGLGDADGSSAPRLTKLQQPGKLPSPLKADSSHHLIVKFTISRPVHQAFLRLYSGKKEIIFIAEPDSSKVYKIAVNLASELAHSGTFEMELILGDSVMSNPIRWVLGSVEVSLSSPGEQEKKSLKGPKPEIRHLFRAPEKRPPEFVSLLFTGLTLSPLLLLLGLWLKLGVNFGNFTTLSVPFHLGFGGILYLFFLFWLKLDMFTTCAWLLPIGGFTFLAGHKLLSHIAKHKKA